MFYQQSKKIFEEIKKAKNILLNTHHNPDLDSIGSSTVLMKVLSKMGKKVKIISPVKIPYGFLFIKDAEKIEAFDFKNFDFNSYDLFIILDTANYYRVTGDKDIFLPNIKKIVIDHHKSNEFTDVKIKLVDDKASATCEIVYKLLLDWNINIDQDMATALFSGIAGDTVFFRYGENNKEMFKIISDLIQKGADKDLLVERMFNNYEFSAVQLIGECLAKMKKEKKFVWSAVNYETFKKFGKPKGIRELAADLFFQSIKGAKFGAVILEEEKNKIYISFRSIKDFDVSKLAKAVGGGGHRHAAGATVDGNFKKIVKTVLKKLII